MLRDQAAAHYLADLACQTVFHHPGPMRAGDLWRVVAATVPVSPDTLTEALEADARFVRVGGRWDLGPRAEVDGRPLGGALATLLQCYGVPMPRALLVGELGLTRPGAPPQMNELLDRLLATGRDLVVFDDCIGLTDWFPRLGSTDPQGQLFLNELTEDKAFLALRPKLTAASLRQRHLVDTAEAVLKAAKMPLHNRALGLVLHAHHGDRFNAAEVFAAMYYDERFYCLSGPAWTLRSYERTWQKALEPKGAAAETEEPATDAAALLQAAPPARMKLEAANLAGLQEFSAALRTPVEAAEGVAEVLGLRPRQRNFAAALHAVDAAFASDPSLARIRPGVYLRREGVPPWVATIPEPLQPARSALSPGYGPEALVPLADLPPDLAAAVVQPHYEDVGETEVVLREEPVQETHLTVPWHHRRCGTMMLRRCDRRLFELPATVTMLTFETPEGAPLPVWANSQTGLIYGLLAWYDENLPPSGATVTLARGATHERFVLHCAAEPDAAARVSEERFAQLLHLRERLQRRPLALSETVAAVLQGQARGLAFDPLWFQLNLVRRTTRHQLASALVLSEALQQADGGRWRAG